MNAPPCGELCIVVVSWNVRPFLERCLQSVFSGRELPPLRVVVVDNASADGSADMVRRSYPSVRVIQTGANLGFPAAVNRAIELGWGEFVLLLNPDAVLSSDALQKLLRVMREQERVGVVGCRIERHDGTLDPSCARNFPRLGHALLRASLLARAAPGIFGVDLLQGWDHTGNRRVPCTSGACMLLRRTMLAEIGVLDDTLPLYFEDMDICYRATQAGWWVHYLGDTTVTHAYNASRAMSQRSVQLQVLEDADAVWLFFRRHQGRLSAATFTAVVLWGAVLRIAIARLGLALHRVTGSPPGVWRERLRINTAKAAWALNPSKPDAAWWNGA
jgi:GT2 family glycosyltransferase